MKLFFALGFALTLPFIAFASDLSTESLVGKWKFVRIVTEEYEMPINMFMEFRIDGTVINSTAAGVEQSRASFQIKDGKIIYTDEKGVQKWTVKDFSGNSLHVDHRGAEMFFEK